MLISYMYNYIKIKFYNYIYYRDILVKVQQSSTSISCHLFVCQTFADLASVDANFWDSLCCNSLTCRNFWASANRLESQRQNSECIVDVKLQAVFAQEIWFGNARLSSHVPFQFQSPRWRQWGESKIHEISWNDEMTELWSTCSSSCCDVWDSMKSTYRATYQHWKFIR